MSDSSVERSKSEARVLARTNLNTLIQTLANTGHRVLGPSLRDGSVVLGDIESDADFPIGWADEQEPGKYRLRDRKTERVFGFAVGPHSLKPHLFVPRRRLLSVDKQTNGSHSYEEAVDPPQKLAIVGARPCDLAAVEVQDPVFMGQVFPDPDYVRRRENMFIAVVNCSHPASTCFCTSMGTGPRASAGFDLALTELYQDDRHDFVVEVGSHAGSLIMDSVETRPATGDDLAAAARVTAEAAGVIVRKLDTEGIRDLLLGNLNDPIWDDIADRCLSCANCTLACPTCFCSTVEEVTDLTGDHAERWQAWDSCFAVDHSYIHGGSVRKSIKSRYRQWMTHKLASWIDQFGMSGCVGCGRCITWCPVGIDITEEAAKLRERTLTEHENDSK
jgi:formate hydrogenlyase subunit 6/NADH:ubiquinone oxidoreductase subunit I